MNEQNGNNESSAPGDNWQLFGTTAALLTMALTGPASILPYGAMFAVALLQRHYDPSSFVPSQAVYPVPRQSNPAPTRLGLFDLPSDVLASMSIKHLGRADFSRLRRVNSVAYNNLRLKEAFEREYGYGGWAYWIDKESFKFNIPNLDTIWQCCLQMRRPGTPQSINGIKEIYIQLAFLKLIPLNEANQWLTRYCDVIQDSALRANLVAHINEAIKETHWADFWVGLLPSIERLLEKTAPTSEFKNPSINPYSNKRDLIYFPALWMYEAFPFAMLTYTIFNCFSIKTLDIRCVAESVIPINEMTSNELLFVFVLPLVPLLLSSGATLAKNHMAKSHHQNKARGLLPPAEQINEENDAAELQITFGMGR